MLINRWRYLVQALSFLVLTYGGRIGINLGFAVPCFSCPFVSGCGGYCFLMFFQRVGIFGIAAVDSLFTYIGIWNLIWFLVFAILCILLSKFWCGWICPFGTFLDVLAACRKKLGIEEIELSWRVRDMLKPVKYIFLAIILVVPLLIAFAGLSTDYYIVFCKICPARPLMPLFAGDARRLALEYSNYTTLALAIISVIFAAITVVGSFFKDRFFCLVCPMLPLIQLFDKFSFVKFTKTGHNCRGCGNCQRICPMDIRQVHDETQDKSVLTEDCILCTQCMQSCPENKALKLSWAGKELFISSRAYFMKKFVKKAGTKHE